MSTTNNYIKVLVKEPNKDIEERQIVNDWETVTDIIGDDFVLYSAKANGKDFLIAMDENARFYSEHEPNFMIENDIFFGNIIFLSIDSDLKTFKDCPISIAEANEVISTDLPTYICESCHETFDDPIYIDCDIEFENGVAGLFPDHHWESIAACPNCESTDFWRIKR